MNQPTSNKPFAGQKLGESASAMTEHARRADWPMLARVALGAIAVLAIGVFLVTLAFRAAVAIV